MPSFDMIRLLHPSLLQIRGTVTPPQAFQCFPFASHPESERRIFRLDRFCLWETLGSEGASKGTLTAWVPNWETPGRSVARFGLFLGRRRRRFRARSGILYVAPERSRPETGRVICRCGAHS